VPQALLVFLQKRGTQGTLFEKASLEPRKAMPKTVVFGGIFKNNNQAIVKWAQTVLTK
jgi:hypothetical protein